MQTSAALAERPAFVPDRSEPALWISSPWLDLVLLVGVTSLTLLPWLATEHLGISSRAVLYTVALLANGPHLISTWTRVYLPRSERFRRPVAYWVVPGIAACFALGCVAVGGVIGPTVLRSVVFYWASWHFVAQSYGVLRIYQRKHGVVDTRLGRLEKALVFLPAAYFVLHRLYTGPWTLFGSEIYHFVPPKPVLDALGVIILGLAAFYATQFRARNAVSWVRPAYLAASAFGFYMPYVAIHQGTAAFAAAALWHAVQYLTIVWLYNRRRYAGGIDPNARWISWVSQPGRSLAYLGTLLLCAVGVYALIVGASRVTWNLQRWSLAVWTGLTLGHYYLDGIIWKFKRYDLAKQLVQR